ncbi:hypothetical protein SGPA1_12239 [Streptomyces misionensis JCM 4497]
MAAGRPVAAVAGGVRGAGPGPARVRPAGAAPVAADHGAGRVQRPLPAGLGVLLVPPGRGTAARRDAGDGRGRSGPGGRPGGGAGRGPGGPARHRCPARPAAAGSPARVTTPSRRPPAGSSLTRRTDRTHR